MGTTCTCQISWAGFPVRSPQMIAQDFDCPVHGAELQRQQWVLRHARRHYRQRLAARRAEIKRLCDELRARRVAEQKEN